METTKEKFFAQYWGQKTALYHDNIFNYDFEFDLRCFNDTKLKLKSLSNLSREDAIFIYCSKNGVLRTENVLLINYEFKNNILCIEIYSRDYDSVMIPPDYFSIKNLSAELTDYLRSKGYAIPFMGLSVDELIKNNWIILE